MKALAEHSRYLRATQCQIHPRRAVCSAASRPQPSRTRASATKTPTSPSTRSPRTWASIGRRWTGWRKNRDGNYVRIARRAICPRRHVSRLTLSGPSAPESRAARRQAKVEQNKQEKGRALTRPPLLLPPSPTGCSARSNRSWRRWNSCGRWAGRIRRRPPMRNERRERYRVSPTRFTACNACAPQRHR